MIIAVDFDGVLHTGNYPNIGYVCSEAVEILKKLAADGHYLILNTCRTGDFLVDAINFLLEHDIPVHRINDNCPYNQAKYGGNTRKVYADVYIDDHNAGGLPDWQTIYEYINSLKQ
jgi:hypothetical protein